VNSQPEMYGTLQSEKIAEENNQCRQIVKEISLFGITDRQRLLIISLLAMELESVDHMKRVTSCINDLAGSEIFISGKVEGDIDG